MNYRLSSVTWLGMVNNMHNLKLVPWPAVYILTGTGIPPQPWRRPQWAGWRSIPSPRRRCSASSPPCWASPWCWCCHCCCTSLRYDSVCPGRGAGCEWGAAAAGAGGARELWRYLHCYTPHQTPPLCNVFCFYNCTQPGLQMVELDKCLMCFKRKRYI